MMAPAGDYRRKFHATIPEVLESAVRIIAADPLLLIPAPKSCTTRKAAALCSRLPTRLREEVGALTESEGYGALATNRAWVAELVGRE